MKVSKIVILIVLCASLCNQLLRAQNGTISHTINLGPDCDSKFFKSKIHTLKIGTIVNFVSIIIASAGTVPTIFPEFELCKTNAGKKLALFSIPVALTIATSSSLLDMLYALDINNCIAS